MSAAVAHLPKASNDEAKLPPFTLTITMNMSGERQVSIHAPFKDEVSRSEANAAADGLMKVAERQRSLQEIAFLEEQLSAKTDALELWKKRQKEADATLLKELADIEVSIADAMKKQEQIKQREYGAARAGGRSGDVKLQGSALKEFNALERAIDQSRGSVSTKTAEHEQRVMQPILGNIEKLEAELREINRQLERHRAIVG